MMGFIGFAMMGILTLCGMVGVRYFVMKRLIRKSEQELKIKVEISWLGYSDFCINEIPTLPLLFLYLILFIYGDMNHFSMEYWLAFGILLITDFVLLTLLKRKFSVRDFLNVEHLQTWSEVNDYQYLTLYEADKYLSKNINNRQYIPGVQKARGLLMEKEKLKAGMEIIGKTSELTPKEEKSLALIEQRIASIDESLKHLLEDFWVAIGMKLEPEKAEQLKKKTLAEIEYLFDSQEDETFRFTDPAIQELVELSENEEAPEDVRKIAKRTALEIQEKLEERRVKEQEESYRQSAKVLVATSRKYHQLDEPMEEPSMN